MSLSYGPILSRLLNCSFPGHKALNSVFRVFKVFSGQSRPYFTQICLTNEWFSMGKSILFFSGPQYFLKFNCQELNYRLISFWLQKLMTCTLLIEHCFCFFTQAEIWKPFLKIVSFSFLSSSPISIWVWWIWCSSV